jgi:dienelactone hydrolase
VTILLGALALRLALVAEPAAAPPLGELVEGLRCQADPSQSYTLYLPKAYTPERRWPLLLVFDPRGRSRLAAELFREAAEALGFILVSSNDTRSDGPMDVNQKALQALWPEAHLRYASDPRRIYAAGFSGGGMLSWELGRRVEGLAGVVASGGRFEAHHFKERIAFPCFGAAGDADFNYAPMKAVHARLREWGTPERFRVFEGAHEWMPAALAGEAIAWLELMAMKGGLRPLDAAFVASGFDRELARARTLEAAGRLLEAQRALEQAASSYDGLADVAGARREAERLASLPATKAALREEQRWDRHEQLMLRRFDEASAELLRSEPPPSTEAFRSAVGMNELLRRSAAAGYEGTVGRRLRNSLATQTGFYMARELLSRQDYRRALAALEIAAEAAPDRPFYWYNLACARAHLGARRQALDALEREEERFQALLLR